MLGIYTRISKDRKNEVSTEVQKQNGIECANHLKLNYILYPEKKGTSGGKAIEDRPELDRLVNDCENGIITAIYVYNQDRAQRNELEWFRMVEMMTNHKIKLYENGILMDFDDENIRILTGIKAIMDASFRRTTSKKIKAALKKKVEQGKATNPVMKYGYTKDKQGYIQKNKKEAKWVKWMYEKSLEGWGTNKIANYLNNNNIPTRYAKSKGKLKTTNKLSGKVTIKKKKEVIWSQNTVLQILKSTWNKGQRPYNIKRNKEKGLPPDYYPVPLIISEVQWNKTQDNLKQNFRKKSGRKTPNWLLKGTLRCKCGKNMFGVYNPKKSENYYKCASNRNKGKACGNRSLNRPFIDNLIWKALFRDKSLAINVKNHFETLNPEAHLNELMSTLSNLNKQLKTLSKQKSNVIELITKEIITQEEGEQQLKRIRQEIIQTEQQSTYIDEQINTYSNIQQSKNDLYEELINIKDTTAFNDKKKVISKYIKDIIISSELIKHKGRITDDDYYKITIKYNISNIEDDVYYGNPKRLRALEPYKRKLVFANNKTYPQGWDMDVDFTLNELDEESKKQWQYFIDSGLITKTKGPYDN